LTVSQCLCFLSVEYNYLPYKDKHAEILWSQFPEFRPNLNFSVSWDFCNKWHFSKYSSSVYPSVF
jgi:hypothetical protein